MRQLNQLVAAACFALSLTLVAGCGGSTETSVTAPAAATVDNATMKKDKEARQKLETSKQDRGAPEPDTGTGGSPAGI